MEDHILVLMSVWNGEKYIEEQLDSILEQEGCRVHLLIRDDGSSDRTPAILARYQRFHENMTVVPDRNNVGAAQSFMSLLCRSETYPFYAFADQDDIWDRRKLISGIRMLEKEEKPAVYASNAALMDAKGNSMGRLLHRSGVHVNMETVLCVNQFPGCSLVFNDRLARMVRSAGFPEVMIMHDYYLTTVCALVGGSIRYDPVPRMYYRQHGDNQIGVSAGTMEKVRDRIRRVCKKKKVSVTAQLKEICMRYEPYISEKNMKFANLLIRTETSFFSRCRVCFSGRVHYKNMNQALSHRLAFLFGNK
ncbi:MAG: glycosyltransferase [Lachnospiraceae bacterium]|nr:glycosyltransferase [Lachnospiraceae bacterium]